MFLSQSGLIYIEGCTDFDPEKIFECGQCFRWNRVENGSYLGVAGGRAAYVYASGSGHVIDCEAGTEDFWAEYFDLDRDYALIRKAVSIDDYTSAAADYGNGIRILKQDFWETLCSFILSQCNNITRIKGLVERLCTLFGDKLYFRGRELYAFPSAERIAALSLDELSPIRSGYRAPYLLEAARQLAAGEITRDKLELSAQPLAALTTINGVGKKVASCVLLFGLHRLDAFPVDVWIAKALGEYFDKGFDPSVYGQYAGVAQQYIFNYIRNKA